MLDVITMCLCPPHNVVAPSTETGTSAIRPSCRADYERYVMLPTLRSNQLLLSSKSPDLLVVIEAWSLVRSYVAYLPSECLLNVASMPVYSGCIWG